VGLEAPRFAYCAASSRATFVIDDDQDDWIDDEVDVCAPDDPVPLELTDDDVEVDA
jgi:hypothetical protein